MKSKTANKDNIAYTYIKNKILRGEFPPNFILDEKELKKILNLSTTPIKNAFKALEKEQFVTIKPKKKTYVKKINLKLVKDLFQMRNKLEYILIELTIYSMEQEKLKNELNKFKNDFENLKEISGFNEVYNNFRFFFANNCGNEFLKNTMILVYEHIYRLRVTIFSNTPRRENAINEQIEIINYILEFGTNIKLKKLVNSHITKAQVAFFENLDEIVL